MADDFQVRVSAGSLRSGDSTYVVPHAWTDDGVAVEGAGTGGHLLHTAIAVCVLNDVLREAEGGGLTVPGVAVTADGGFDGDWASTGVTYSIELDTVEDETMVERLLARVDEVAEIPRAVRAGASVTREVAGG